jgi:predicted MFS family arabinose efflux permease
MASASPVAPVFTRYEKLVIAMLAFLQFTVIIDFMIMSPLGAAIMPALGITPAQFGVAVSAYAFSAGISGLLAAGFADRYDRKKLLLVFYSGFLLGTLFCGLAPTYPLLLAARIVTGLFGGVIGAIILAITADLFPLSSRGRVMGLMQTSFAASQILGLPAGLYFSNHWGWHAPFLVIVAIGAVVGVFIYTGLRPINAHLALKPGRSPVHHLVSTFTNVRYLPAFVTLALISIGGYMIMPFSSAFTVHNLGIPLEHLPMIYLVTGIASMLIGPMVGRLCDRFGNLRVFVFGSSVSIVTVLTYTHLGVTPLPWVLLINMVMFIGIFSRMIPSQTLMSAIPEPENRGSFMSVNSSLQQMMGGLGSVIAGAIVVATSTGALLHFERVGYVMVATIVAALALMPGLQRLALRRQAG